MNQPSASAATEHGALRIHPPLLAVSLLVATPMIHLLLGHPAVALHHFLGPILVAGGIGLSFFAAALFQARETTKNPYGEPAVFVSHMPYTFTRNPMYLVFAAALLGFAIFFGSIVMATAPLIFVVAIDRLVIPSEEAALERRFGEFTENTKPTSDAGFEDHKQRKGGAMRHRGRTRWLSSEC